MASKNPNVKRGQTNLSLTPEEESEFIKCSKNPLHFIQNYVYVRHPVKGQTLFKLYGYQKKLIDTYHKNKEVITLLPRQSGKSETSCAYLFWFSIFHEDKTVLITSNKHKNAREMISRIKYMYEHLPDFLKPGVTDDGWNAMSLIFETGSRILSDATSESTGRGGSFSILYGDETAFVRSTIQEEFWASISPTLATGGKLFLTSTPNGDSDLFATLWRGATSGTNGFVPFTIKWSDVPGRDDDFKKREIAKNGMLKWLQEFECCAGHEIVAVVDPNGHTYEISMENLALQLNHTPLDEMKPGVYANSDGLRILTPGGFETFDGVAFTGVRDVVSVRFTDGNSLTTTLDHKVFVRGQAVQVSSLLPGMRLSGYQKPKIVASIGLVGRERVFDVVNTESHTYFTSGVVSHNCVFVSSDPLLIDSMKAQLLIPTEPVTVNHGIKIWEHFSPDNTEAGDLVDKESKQGKANSSGSFDNWYKSNTQQFSESPSLKPNNKQCIMTVDPGKGIGNDYTVIEVFSYPGLSQMMEYRTNSTKTGEIYKVLKYLWKKAGQAKWDVLFTVENNGVGEGLITLFETDETLPDNVEMISDGGKQQGMNTNNSSKLGACRIFKEFIESGKLKVVSPDLIREIKTFAQSKGSYSAQLGSTDDCVSATLLVCRVVKQLASYDTDAYDSLYTVGELSDDDIVGGEDGGDDYDEMPIIF